MDVHYVEVVAGDRLGAVGGEHVVVVAAVAFFRHDAGPKTTINNNQQQSTTINQRRKRRRSHECMDGSVEGGGMLPNGSKWHPEGFGMFNGDFDWLFTCTLPALSDIPSWPLRFSSCKPERANQFINSSIHQFINSSMYDIRIKWKWTPIGRQLDAKRTSNTQKWTQEWT